MHELSPMYLSHTASSTSGIPCGGFLAPSFKTKTPWLVFEDNRHTVWCMVNEVSRGLLSPYGGWALSENARRGFSPLSGIRFTVVGLELPEFSLLWYFPWFLELNPGAIWNCRPLELNLDLWGGSILPKVGSPKVGFLVLNVNKFRYFFTDCWAE